jgi:fructose-1,6-bisphosphatase/inositol monophosphatase family enzyme
MKKKTYSHARAPGQTSINVSVPVEVKSALEVFCKEADLTVSQIVRKMIREKGPEYGIKIEEKESEL